MSQNTINSKAMAITPEAQPAPVIPLGVLENLAARCRPGGLCLMLLRPDGSVSYHDTVAGTFFQRFVVPLIQYPDPVDKDFRDRLFALNASSPVTILNQLHGIVVAAFPHVERRQMNGILLLAGKGVNFKLSEDVVRVCGRVGLDGIWLNQQAEELPSYGEEAIQRQARLLHAMVRDQVRLSSMEHELASLSGQLANTYEELSLIYQISGGMRVNRRPADFFKQTCLDSMEVMGVRGIGVALKAGDVLGQEPVMYGPLSLPPGKVRRLAVELLEWMVKHKTSLLINEMARDKRFSWMGDSAQRLLAVPLQRGEEVLGVLFTLEKENSDFDSVDSKLLNSIANESAIYLENAVLFEDVHGLMMGLLHSLTSAVDAKDAYTCGHSERVALLSTLLAKEAGLDERAVERIYMAGLLHDVGKIGVPESVLQKPGKLTAEEFEQMKKHPAIGAHILQDVKQISDLIPGVLHHHERYDGKGYPDGLAGQSIPLMGRIICLADCFDAMTSTRTYRKALPLEVTLADIRRCSGTQFDPALTEAFLRIGTDRFREILRQQESATHMDLGVTPVPPTTNTAPASIAPPPASTEKAA
jgi:HD-GYP domain-containing protein (c-di-GMP phosphodiesterase class II)